MNTADSGVLEKIKRVRHSVASSGLARTLADLTIRAVNATIGYDAERDRSFDARYGTDTTGRIQPQDLGITDDSARETARVYLASPPRVTRWMLRNAGIDHTDFTFVDLGCGKGRVLLVASDFPFRAIHGVDISAELCEIARRNIAIYQPPSRRCVDVQVHNQNATKFEFPAGNLLIHCYHPFEVELTVSLLRPLVDPLDSAPRRVFLAYLVYNSDVEAVKAALGRLPWLKLLRYEQSVTGEYDWLFFSN